MKGFSLSAIVLEEGIEKALLSDVETAGWQKPVQPRAVNIMPSTLASALDAKVGDGDPGSTFAAGAREIADLLQRQQLPLNDLPTLFALIGEPDGGDGRLQRGIDVYILHRCRAEAGTRRQRGRGAERRSGQMVLRRRR